MKARTDSGRAKKRSLGAGLTICLMLLAGCGGGAGEEPAGEGGAGTESRATGADEGEGADGEVEEFVLAVETPQGDQLSNLLTYAAEEIEAELGDRVTVEPFYGGALGDEVAILEGLRAGEIDMVSAGSDIVELDPIFGIFEFPFLFSSREEVVQVLDGELGDQMSESLIESQGLRVLGFGENGFRNITNNVRPVEVPSDLEGLTLRVPGVQMRVATFELFGANPVAMDFGEIYVAADQGVIDGQENPLAIIDQASFYEVQEHLSLSQHVYTPASLLMNQERWEQLPDDVQQGIDAAVARAVERSRADGQQFDDELVAKLSEDMEVTEIDVDAFREASMPVWEEYKSEVGEDFVDQIFEALGIN